MRIVLLLACVLCICSIPALAQHEADNWYFGYYAGISFQNGIPTAVGDGQTRTVEGCATISDKTTGKLLFYTDGVTVWNSNHQIMKDGIDLKGGKSATQSALIVQDPGNNLQYYIFTVSDFESQKYSLHYTLLSLKNPSGEIISKNNLLLNNVSEKLTGTIDCSGMGFWVVAHHSSNSSFYSFHLTGAGVNSLPVISTYVSEITDFDAGYMKISPDRSKLGLVAAVGNYIALFSFNATTGIVTNYKQWNDGGNSNGTYGLSFSPDNSKLYITDFSESIYQFEINLPDVVSIRNSIIILKGEAKYNRALYNGALQLGPDGRIYVAQDGEAQYIGVIEQPNLKGSACKYKANSIPLKGLCNSGLPNFMDYIFNSTPAIDPFSPCAPRPIVTSHSSCLGTDIVFTDKSINSTSRIWTFEGGTPATSTDSIVTVTYSKSGTYKVILTAENINGRVSDTAESVIFPLPTANAGEDKNICQNEKIQLGDKPEAGNKYTWLPTTDLDNPNIANPNTSPQTTTQYILTVTSEHGCIAYDTVFVTVGNIEAKVSNDTSICSGASVQLLASGGAKYTWSPSTGLSDTTIENPIATPAKTTTYKVLVSSGTCEDSAFVTITVNPQPTAKAGEDKTLCIGSSTEIGEAAQAGFLYNWQPTSGLDDATKANPSAAPTSTTQYILTVTGNGGCTASDTVLVTIGTIKAIVSNDTSICEGASAKLFASGGAKYEWSPSTGLDNSSLATPTANPTSTTKYKVLVSSGTCVDSNFVTVTILPPPNAYAGNDTTICIGASTQIGIPAEAGYSYSWSPSNGLLSPTASQTSASPAATTTYTLQVTNPAGCVNSDEVIVTVNPLNERSFRLQPDTVIILPGKEFTTSLGIPNGVNDWSVKLYFDPLLVKYKSISGAQAIPDDLKGEVLVSGNGGSRSIPITFDAFLPHTSDTTYPVLLAIDSSKITECEIWNATGTTLMLADYCGKSIRVVSSTGKKYFLTIRDKSIDFGIGLSGYVRLEVFDYVGNSVLIVSDAALEAGEYSAALDLPIGVYYCRMRAGMYEQVGKVLIAR